VGRGDAGVPAVLVTLPSAGTRERVRDGVREAARTRKGNSTARVGFGRDWGVAAGNAAEPGQRHGWRRARRPRSALECACEVRLVARRARGGQRGRCSPPVRPRARPTRPQRGCGGAGRPKHGGESYARGKGGQGPTLLPELTCARAGVHDGAGASGPRGYARESERERERLGAASRTRVARHGDQQQQGETRPEKASARRRRQRHLQTSCPSLARRPASPTAARWHRATARSTSARRPKHPHEQGSGRPHLGGHGP
jgi:hypothetical protein